MTSKWCVLDKQKKITEGENRVTVSFSDDRALLCKLSKGTISSLAVNIHLLRGMQACHLHHELHFQHHHDFKWMVTVDYLTLPSHGPLMESLSCYQLCVGYLSHMTEANTPNSSTIIIIKYSSGMTKPHGRGLLWWGCMLATYTHVSFGALRSVPKNARGADEGKKPIADGTKMIKIL